MNNNPKSFKGSCQVEKKIHCSREKLLYCNSTLLEQIHVVCNLWRSFRFLDGLSVVCFFVWNTNCNCLYYVSKMSSFDIHSIFFLKKKKHCLFLVCWWMFLGMIAIGQRTYDYASAELSFSIILIARLFWALFVCMNGNAQFYSVSPGDLFAFTFCRPLSQKPMGYWSQISCGASMGLRNVICTNAPGPVTKMATMPIYGKKP